MTFILPSFGASAIAAVPGGGGGFTNDYSISLDGTDHYLDTNSTFQSTFQSAFSVSMWFKFDDVSANNEALFGVDNTGYYDRILIWKNTSNQIGAFYTANQQSVSAITSSGVTVTNWNHLVFVVQQNGSSVETELYINGVSQATNSATSTMANYGTVNAGADVFIGAKNEVPVGGVNLAADALIDEAAIIPSALSSSDVTSIYNSGVPTDISSFSPVGWWRMGDSDSGAGTTITDQGSGGNDGTLVNGPTFSTNVPFNYYSVEFDGTNDYVDLGTYFSPFNFGTGDFTVSQWFKPSSISAGSYQGLVGSHDGGNTIWSTFARSDGFYIFGGSALIGGGTIANGQWYHGVVIRNSGTVTVYLNGSSVTSVSNTGEFNSSSSQPSKIGADNANAAFAGLIDEVAIWSTPLSASDVTAIYNSGTPDDLTSYSPVGWWRMGDGTESGSGTTVYDMTTNSNNGTLTNGPTYSTTVPS